MSYVPYRELQKYDDELLDELKQLDAAKVAEDVPTPTEDKPSVFEAFSATVSDDLESMNKAAELEGARAFEELAKTSRLRDVLDEIKTQRDPMAYLAVAQASKE